ncbi:MAG: hypothetical protein ACLR8Y_11485 [Alistipes indistinctus]
MPASAARLSKTKLFFFINGELEYKSFLGNQWQPSTDGVGSAENKISQTTIADLEKVSDYLQKTYGYNPGAYQNFGNSAADNYKIMARIDWNISKNHKLMVRYNDVKSQDDNLVSGASTPGGVRLNNAGRNSINSISFANTGYKQEKPRAFDHGRVEQRLQPEGLEQAASLRSRTSTTPVKRTETFSRSSTSCVWAATVKPMKVTCRSAQKSSRSTTAY